MARRGSSVSELQKKRKKNEEKVKNLGGDKKYVQNRKNTQGGGGVSGKTTSSTKGKTKAQLMALKNIKKYGGTASAAAANKEAMRLKIKKKYLASKKKK